MLLDETLGFLFGFHQFSHEGPLCVSGFSPVATLHLLSHLLWSVVRFLSSVFMGLTDVKSCDPYSQYINVSSPRSPARRCDYPHWVGEEIAMVSASESGSDLI